MRILQPLKVFHSQLEVIFSSSVDILRYQCVSETNMRLSSAFQSRQIVRMNFKKHIKVRNRIGVHANSLQRII